jgi:hypothetical protein
LRARLREGYPLAIPKLLWKEVLRNIGRASHPAIRGIVEPVHSDVASRRGARRPTG